MGNRPTTPNLPLSAPREVVATRSYTLALRADAIKKDNLSVACQLLRFFRPLFDLPILSIYIEKVSGVASGQNGYPLPPNSPRRFFSFLFFQVVRLLCIGVRYPLAAGLFNSYSLGGY